MPALIERFRNSIGTEGIVATARKCFIAPIRQIRCWPQRYRRWRFNHSADAKVIFETAYRLNYWGSKESVSGPGSTLDYTANLRRHLPIVFNEYAIRTVFDAPCGDFNWMRKIVSTNSIRYMGGDIVPALIKANRTAHAGSRTEFFTFDITRDKFPEADLWICRDCLFHLSFREIYDAMVNFSESGVRYVLLTNHRSTASFDNCDIRTGGCRRLNLLAPPFNFPPEIKYRIHEGSSESSEHEMCLWDRNQITSALSKFKSALDAANAGHPK
jgi:hypothetical protein